MGTRMRDLLDSALPSLRYEPTEKHLRIHLDGEPVADGEPLSGGEPLTGGESVPDGEPESDGAELVTGAAGGFGGSGSGVGSGNGDGVGDAWVGVAEGDPDALADNAVESDTGSAAGTTTVGSVASAAAAPGNAPLA